MGNSKSSSTLPRQNTVDDVAAISARKQPYEGLVDGVPYSYCQVFRTELQSVLDLSIAILAGTRYDICQDNAVVLTPCKNYLLAAVFDGHGPIGHIVAQRLVVEAKYAFEDHQGHVIELLEQGPATQIEEFSERVHAIFDKDKKYMNSGSTATLALIEENCVHFGWVGDSSAVLFTIKEGEITFKLITKPHDLSTEEEIAYVKNHGGRVESDGTFVKRIFDKHKTRRGPALAMSRAVGDVAAKKYGCRFEFEYTRLSLDDLDGEHCILVVASDGLWNVWTLEEVADLVLKYSQEENIGRSLAEASREEWLRHIPKIDDISVIAVRLK